MTDRAEQHPGEESETAHAFLASVVELARVFGTEVGVGRVGQSTRQRARSLAGALRRPLRESPRLAEELFAPMMEAAVHDPDPSFCGWFVEPAVYNFGRRRVMEALVERLRSGTDRERAGAARAWYWSHAPIREGRSPAYPAGTARPEEMDRAHDVTEAWDEVSMGVHAETADPEVRWRVRHFMPGSRRGCPPRLRGLFAATVDIARASTDPEDRAWARRVDAADAAAPHGVTS